MERKGKKVICRKDKMRRCIEQEQPSTLENRFLYGDVRTKFNFIDKLLDMLPSELFGNEQLEWLDPCCGDGRFPALLYERLDDGLMKIIPNNTKRKKHIIKKMLHMVEFNGEYIPQLVDIFGWDANISQLDFLSMRRCKFDIISKTKTKAMWGILLVILLANPYMQPFHLWHLLHNTFSCHVAVVNRVVPIYTCSCLRIIFA